MAVNIVVIRTQTLKQFWVGLHGITQCFAFSQFANPEQGLLLEAA